MNILNDLKIIFRRPNKEDVELNPTRPAASVIKEIPEKNTLEGEDRHPPFAAIEPVSNNQSLEELRLASEHMRKETERLKQRDIYLENVNTPKAVGKQRIIPRYKFPPVSCLAPQQKRDDKSMEAELRQTADLLVATLKSFGVNTKIVNISLGPTVTRYELQPETGVRLNRIVLLSDDIAMNLAATSIRIEAPIPGKSAVGIEVPNKISQVVRLRTIIESEEFQKSEGALTFALGTDITGAVKVGDIEKMPHLLIAGATGMGKSVCIHSILISLLYKYDPQQLRMILVDPKMVEFGAYNGLPHLIFPVVTDPKKAAGALGWAVGEALKRYRVFSQTGNTNITEYNNWVEKKWNDPNSGAPKGSELEKLPRVIIVIDELAELMQVAANEVENAISRLTVMARAAGIHLILATQRPSSDVITSAIKNNIPSRIAFAVPSWRDSRTILNESGAEELLGRGDLLYMPVGVTKPIRIQGSLVSKEEVDQVVRFVIENNAAE